MKRIFPILVIFILAACAAPTQTQTSEFLENSEVSPPTLTPNPSTLTGTSPTRRGESSPTPTPTPLPSFSRAELDSMDEAQKIAQAPPVDEMPADLRGAEVQWSEPVIAEAGWGTIVQYSGADENGNEVNAYYDLENGAWVERYESLDQVAQIPADQIPEALVVGDEVLTSRVSADYEPSEAEEGKLIFRDAKGVAQIVYDRATNFWQTGMEAGLAPSEISDLNPNYTETVSMKFMGAQIDASLITDKSLDPIIRKVTVGERAYAEFMARSIYGVWAKDHPDQSFEIYMKMLTEVQNGERDPLEVAIPLYANDARDGIPYQNPDKSVNPKAQKKYLVVPWYTGDLPVSPDGTEARGLKEINIAYVYGRKVKNITMFTEDTNTGYGTNINGDKLYFYIAGEYFFQSSNPIKTAITDLSSLPWWIKSNHGQTTIKYLSLSVGDKKLAEILRYSGLDIKPLLK